MGDLMQNLVLKTKNVFVNFYMKRKKKREDLDSFAISRNLQICNKLDMEKSKPSNL